MPECRFLAIDLAKNVFQLHGAASDGALVFKRRLMRDQLSTFVANLAPCQIAMEASASAHHWARVFRRFGHEVKLISPQFVRPFVKGSKNDGNDAEAIWRWASAISRCTRVKSLDLRRRRWTGDNSLPEAWVSVGSRFRLTR